VVGRPPRLDFMAEEHAVGRVEAGSDMRMDDRLEVVPPHVCSCVNMFDHAYGVWDERVDRQIRVAARGRML
jgi:D-serine deaminase-like pyridoxal phosphate-dependent protein